MTAQPKQQNIDLWEAWIDFQSSEQTDSCGTLYVIGDVFMSTNWKKPHFIKMNRKNVNTHELSLEIFPNVDSDGDFVTEIMYAENLNDINQYDAIKIYAGNELVTIIRDIEKLY